MLKQGYSTNVHTANCTGRPLLPVHHTIQTSNVNAIHTVRWLEALGCSSARKPANVVAATSRAYTTTKQEASASPTSTPPMAGSSKTLGNSTANGLRQHLQEALQTGTDPAADFCNQAFKGACVCVVADLLAWSLLLHSALSCCPDVIAALSLLLTCVARPTACVAPCCNPTYAVT